MKRHAAVPALAWPILLLLLAAAGCSTLNGTRLEPLLGADVNLVRLGDRVAESLLTQAVPPLLPRHGFRQRACRCFLVLAPRVGRRQNN